MANIDQLINQAKNLLSKSKFDDAEIIFNEILKIEPTYFKAYINIGVICINQNKLYKAEENFKKAIEIKPDFELAYFNLGTVQEKLEKIEEEYGDIFKGTLLYCYKKYCPKKYDFISMKLRENPPKMYRGFTQEISWKKHRAEAKNFKFDDFIYFWIQVY